MEPKTPNIKRAATITATSQRLADIPAIASSFLNLSTIVATKLSSLPTKISIVGLEEYRSIVLRELVAQDSRTPGVLESAVKDEHDFKYGQKVELEMLVDQVKDALDRCTEALQMVVDAKPVYLPNIGDERMAENQQTLLSTVTYHHKSAGREQPWQPLDEHKTELQKELKQLNLRSRLDLLEVDERLAEADLETLRYQLRGTEQEKAERMELIRDLKVQCARKEGKRQKEDEGEEDMVREEHVLPLSVKSENEDKAEIEDGEPWIV